MDPFSYFTTDPQLFQSTLSMSKSQTTQIKTTIRVTWHLLILIFPHKKMESDISTICKHACHLNIKHMVSKKVISITNNTFPQISVFKTAPK